MSETSNRPIGARPRAADEKFCHACGEPIKSHLAVCPQCGVKQSGVVSKTALLLLTFFLGGVGAHKFYLRKTWQGFFYLLFFWTGIPRVISLVEFVIYVFTPGERLREKYTASASATVIAVVATVFAVAIIGILAAIAIPAYQDYTIRARMNNVLGVSKAVQSRVVDYIVKNQSLPNSNADIGLADRPPDELIQSIDVGPQGEVTITLGPKFPTVSGKTILLTPQIEGQRLYWHCHPGTLPDRYLPRYCRNNSGAADDMR